MLTFQDQYELVQQISKEHGSDYLEQFKRDINEGAALFLNRLGRQFNREYLTANLESGEQYYQLSGEVLRISEIRCKNGSNYYTPQQVASEAEWNLLNTMTVSGNYPTHFFIRGYNEIGLYPVPGTTVTDGLVISYEPQHSELTQADFTTGTVTVSAGTQTITHSGSGFSPQMVGRYFQVTDGSDGRWYRISGFNGTNSLSLENFYEGIDGSGRTFRIGEVMKLPQGFQKAPVDYALSVYYESEGSSQQSQSYLGRFERSLKLARKSFARSTSQIGVKVSGLSGRRASWIDLTPPITYP